MLSFNIEYWAAGSIPDSLELARLEGLATSCPLDSGSSVYLARAILSASDTLIHREWINECELIPEPPSERRGLEEIVPGQNDTYPSLHISIYPNPTNRIVWIQVDGCDPDAKLEYSISDPLGHLYSRGLLSCGSNKIDLGLLQGGLYFIQISGVTNKIILVP
jgi:hypothetical protein